MDQFSEELSAKKSIPMNNQESKIPQSLSALIQIRKLRFWTFDRPKHRLGRISTNEGTRKLLISEFQKHRCPIRSS